MNFAQKRFSIVDAIDLLFLVIVFGITLFSNSPYLTIVIASLIVLVLFLIGAAELRRRPLKTGWRPVIQVVYPVVFLFAVFETFFMILPYFNTNRYDAILIGIDYAWFGVHPTVWIERFFHPGLTELLFICYFLYFPMPLLAVYYLYRTRQWKRLEETLFIFMVVYYVGYIGYFIVPASGPRFNLAQFQTVPLEGLWLTNPIRSLIEILEPNKLDAFPSLHSAILTATMLTAYRVHRRMFVWFIPLAIGIMISLVYCRYHYVIDIVAGFLYVAIAYPIGLKLFEKWRGRFADHFTDRDTAQ